MVQGELSKVHAETIDKLKQLCRATERFTTAAGIAAILLALSSGALVRLVWACGWPATIGVGFGLMCLTGGVLGSLSTSRIGSGLGRIASECQLSSAELYNLAHAHLGKEWHEAILSKLDAERFRRERKAERTSATAQDNVKGESVSTRSQDISAEPLPKAAPPSPAAPETGGMGTRQSAAERRLEAARIIGELEARAAFAIDTQWMASGVTRLIELSPQSLEAIAERGWAGRGDGAEQVNLLLVQVLKRVSEGGNAASADAARRLLENALALPDDRTTGWKSLRDACCKVLVDLPPAIQNLQIPAGLKIADAPEPAVEVGSPERPPVTKPVTAPAPMGPPCSHCKRSMGESSFKCPHCGHADIAGIAWLAVGGNICLIVSAFLGSRVSWWLWRVLLKWLVGITGGICLAMSAGVALSVVFGRRRGSRPAPSQRLQALGVLGLLAPALLLLAWPYAQYASLMTRTEQAMDLGEYAEAIALAEEAGQTAWLVRGWRGVIEKCHELGGVKYDGSHDLGDALSRAGFVVLPSDSKGKIHALRVSTRTERGRKSVYMSLAGEVEPERFDAKVILTVELVSPQGEVVHALSAEGAKGAPDKLTKTFMRTPQGDRGLPLSGASPSQDAIEEQALQKAREQMIEMIPTKLPVSLIAKRGAGN